MATSTPNSKTPTTTTTTQAATPTPAAASPPRSTPPSSTQNTITLFTQLKTVAESGCKIHPDFYYDYTGYAEHTLQFSITQYALLTGGQQERPDLEWERASQIYLARKNIPHELVTLPLSDVRANTLAAAAAAAAAGAGRGANDSKKNKYIMAGVPRVSREEVLREGNGTGKVLITNADKGKPVYYVP
ncbi:hypothetical protein DTO027B5_6559 [Paecilomyces variotii]|nr:hypothetical protein DTO169C6_9252 [Paecilomyces variotii]KAJ9261605.1 hypothetical protein DTO195F2_4135 [Paecilomyces variotii]KAJ9325182.1 hypothetical protein DTO027B3_3661 [Paecilomyces variotii]KAJ9331739.1 hypothetical protein DTO027B5_6559 [Paecilomyces variotii]KAJ9358625.1 hypothetical protein DTO027B9_2298 [Paecilomyces variotii]